jgi:DNA-binding transcriptional MerR regulator
MANGRTTTSGGRRVEQDSLDAALAGLTGDAGEGSAESGFRGPQVCKIVGITYRQLDYWARTDLVRPTLADAHGSGTQRRYSYRDLVRLKVVKSLLDAGVKLQTARKAIEYIRGDLGDDWASASLVLNGTNSVLVRTGDDLVDVVRHGQGVLNIVSLGQVVDELQASIHDLADVASDDTRTPTRSRAGGPAAAEGG